MANRYNKLKTWTKNYLFFQDLNREVDGIFTDLNDLDTRKTNLADCVSSKIASKIVKRDTNSAAELDVTGNLTGSVTGDVTGDLKTGSTIDGQALTDIFEPDKTTVKKATEATTTTTDFRQYILIRDEKDANTQGGTATSGAWRTRVLNTEVIDTGNNATLNSNQITLKAGTYEIHIKCPAYGEAGRHQARLYNITTGATALVGTSESTVAAATSSSIITGRIALDVDTILEVQHSVLVTKTTSGFGVASDFGEKEVYTVAEFWKVA